MEAVFVKFLVLLALICPERGARGVYMAGAGVRVKGGMLGMWANWVREVSSVTFGPVPDAEDLHCQPVSLRSRFLQGQSKFEGRYMENVQHSCVGVRRTYKGPVARSRHCVVRSPSILRAQCTDMRTSLKVCAGPRATGFAETVRTMTIVGTVTSDRVRWCTQDPLINIASSRSSVWTQ